MTSYVAFITVDQVGMDVCVVFDDSRTTVLELFGAAHFVVDDDDDN